MTKRGPAHFDVTIRTAIKGFDDREFKVIVTSDKGVSVRSAGGQVSRTLSWRDIMGMVLIQHGDLA